VAPSDFGDLENEGMPLEPRLSLPKAGAVSKRTQIKKSYRGYFSTTLKFNIFLYGGKGKLFFSAVFYMERRQTYTEETGEAEGEI
jgi:hypothetical protein